MLQKLNANTSKVIAPLLCLETTQTGTFDYAELVVSP